MGIKSANRILNRFGQIEVYKGFYVVHKGKSYTHVIWRDREGTSDSFIVALVLPILFPSIFRQYTVTMLFHLIRSFTVVFNST